MAFLAKSDNAKSLVTNNPLTSGGLSITLTTGTGAKFPSTGQFVVTLWDNTTYSDPGDDPTMEKVLIDSRSVDTLTVNASGRGYDGTSAVAHPQGTRIALLNIKKHFTDIEVGITNGAGNQSTGIDTDGTLAANSDVKIPSQKAVYTAIGAGWLSSESATYVSQDGSTGVFNIASDVTGKYSPGMRYKYQQSQALMAYWTFNTNSNSDVGSFNGTDTAMTYTAGKFGNAATFNGTTSKIVIADNASLKPTGEFTIGMWFKKTGAGTQKVLFQSYSVNTSTAGINIQVTTGNVISLNVGKNSGGTTLGVDYIAINGITNVADNAWHYFVCAFRNNYVQVYVDGKLDGAGYCFTPVYAATNYVRVGCYNPNGSDSLFFDGQIDDLFLINGYALDEKTIKAQYDAQAAQGTGNITVTKYGLITAVGAYSGGNTPITIWGGTDYSLQNATISSPYYATVQNPFGFNKNPAKWTVDVSRSIVSSQSSPTINIWYNINSNSITIPIGNWKIEYYVAVYIDKSTAGDVGILATLSNTNNGESDKIYTSFFKTTIGGSGQSTNTLTHSKNEIILSQTTKYLNISTPFSGMGTIIIDGASSPTIIRAVSTLL